MGALICLYDVHPKNCRAIVSFVRLPYRRWWPGADVRHLVPDFVSAYPLRFRINLYGCSHSFLLLPPIWFLQSGQALTLSPHCSTAYLYIAEGRASLACRENCDRAEVAGGGYNLCLLCMPEALLILKQGTSFFDGFFNAVCNTLLR